MRAPPDRSTSVVIGTPSPRAPGSAATGTEYTLPLSPKPSRVSTVRHSNAPYSASPALKVNWATSWPMPVRARTQPFSETMTVTGSSTTFCSATAFCASSITVRRTSPNCLASASISRMITRFMVDGLSRMSCSVAFSLRSSASSCWILMVSRRASWRRRISRMSSAWMSDRRNSAISAAFGSSELRMMWITLSMLSRIASRPSRMWMRLSTLRHPELGAAAHRDEAELDPLLR